MFWFLHYCLFLFLFLLHLWSGHCAILILHLCRVPWLYRSGGSTIINIKIRQDKNINNYHHWQKPCWPPLFWLGLLIKSLYSNFILYQPTIILFFLRSTTDAVLVRCNQNHFRKCSKKSSKFVAKNFIPKQFKYSKQSICCFFIWSRWVFVEKEIKIGIEYIYYGQSVMF